MNPSPVPLSRILLEMSECLLDNPTAPPTSEAAHVTLLFATAAWNESVGLTYARDGYRHVWETIEADNPEFWKELKSNDVEAMIDELVSYKQARCPNDRRRILTCGIIDGKIRAEWLPAAAPGVDSSWEMALYGLVRRGDRAGAIQYLQTTRNLSHFQAAKQVADIAAQLGVG